MGRVWGKRGLVLCDISHSLVNSSISVSQRHLKFKLNIFPESVPSFLLLQCISTLLRNTVNCLAFFPLLSWSSLYIPLSHECFSIVSRLFLLSLPHQHCTNFSLHHFAFKVRRHNSFAYSIILYILTNQGMLCTTVGIIILNHKVHRDTFTT